MTSGHLPSVRWQEIREHSGSKNSGFEELCYQLMRHSDGIPDGAKFKRHGTPDGGVEFLATLPDASVWAWQAKYLFKLGNSEYEQLTKSYVAALETQPNLSKYFFCLPFNHPAGAPGENSWKRWEHRKEIWIKKCAELKHGPVEIEFIGSSELVLQLTNEEHAGRLYYWFNSLHLSLNWLRERMEETRLSAGPRYTPELNVDVPISAAFEGLCRTDQFETIVKQSSLDMLSKMHGLSLISGISLVDEDIIEQYTTLRQELTTVHRQIVESKLSGLGLYPVNAIGGWLSEVKVRLEALRERTWSLLSGLPSREDRTATSEVGPGRALQDRRDALGALGGLLHRTLGALLSLVEVIESDAGKLADLPVMVLIGRAGTGKTHLCLDVALRRLAEGCPSVVILAQHFRSGEPWRQLLDELHLRCTPEVFLGALDSASEAAGYRGLLVVDAINESGADVWDQRLAAFVTAVRRFQHIGLVLTCRSPAAEVILGEGSEEFPRVEVTHNGFAERAVEAVERFFGHFGLVLPDFPIVTPEFENPLFLKLMCTALRSRGLTRFPRGATSVTTLFGWFLEATEEALAHTNRLDYRRGQKLANRAVSRLAEEMEDTDREWVPLPRAEEMVNALLPSRPWSRSLLRGLLDEGVLIQDAGAFAAEPTDDDVVRFGYQRLADYMRADVICQRRKDVAGIRSLLAGWTAQGENGLWRRANVVQALAVMVPERYSAELYTLTDFPHHHVIKDAILQSLLWRDVGAFDANTDALLQYLQDGRSSHTSDSILDTLLELACVENHPFNAELLHSWLWPRSMAERDVRWTLYLQNCNNLQSPVGRLIDWCRFHNTENCSDNAAWLCGTILTWYLVSTNRELRDAATKSLVQLLSSRSSILLNILRRFHEVSDPYVSERLYAVAYGCCLKMRDPANVEALARLVYDQVFANEQPPVHILLRDYARSVIEYALHLKCGFTDDEVQVVRGPYRSPWPPRVRTAERVADLQNDRYRQIRSSLGSMGDFRRYIIEPQVRKFIAPNQRMRKRERGRKHLGLLERSWSEFVTLLSEEQLVLLDGSNGWDASERRGFQDGLTEPQIRELSRFQSVDLQSRVLDEPVAFDAELASHWIFARVIGLGWTWERFGRFDAWQRDMSDGSPHRERIGKKYQWIAWHELLARLVDHCLTFDHSAEPQTRAVRGAWDLGIRDVDPSLVTGRRPDWPTPANVWWVPMAPDLGRVQRIGSGPWLEASDDLPTPAELASVRGRDGREWLVLEGHRAWHESVPPGIERYSVDRGQVWYWLSSYIVERGSLAEFLAWATGRRWYGRYMPEVQGLHHTFIGEYPWHDSLADDVVQWTDDTRRDVALPCRVAPSWADFQAIEDDRSFSETPGGSVPGLVLLEALGARWVGPAYEFAGLDGGLLAWDPSAYEPGPSTLLVERDALIERLEDSELAVVWLISGEKMVLPGGESPVGAPLMDFSAVMWLEGDRLVSSPFHTTFDRGRGTE